MNLCSRNRAFPDRIGPDVGRAVARHRVGTDGVGLDSPTYARTVMQDTIMTRRELLCRSGMGMGALALGGLMAEAGLLGRPAVGAEGSPSTPAGSSPGLTVNPLLPKAPPLPAKAKRVVHLFMNG